MGQEFAKPVVLSRDERKQRFVGDIDLQVSNDYSVCSTIAKEGYIKQLGAQSLIYGVKRLVEDEVLDYYLNVKAELIEGQSIATYRVDVNKDDEIEAGYIQKKPSKNYQDWIYVPRKGTKRATFVGTSDGDSLGKCL